MCLGETSAYPTHSSLPAQVTRYKGERTPSTQAGRSRSYDVRAKEVFKPTTLTRVRSLHAEHVLERCRITYAPSPLAQVTRYEGERTPSTQAGRSRSHGAKVIE